MAASLVGSRAGYGNSHQQSTLCLWHQVQTHLYP